METSFASRVHEYRKFKGLSQIAFAAQCGLEQGNITQMEKGTEPKQSNVAKLLAGHPDLNPDWLLLGTGSMLRDGRALTPAPTSASEPDSPRLTSTAATVQHTDSLLLREQMQERIEGLQADKAYYREMVDYYVEFVKKLQAENNQLLGKPSDSSDAADDLAQPEAPTPPPAPVRGVLPLPRLRVQVVRGFRSYQDAAELS